MWPFKRKQNLSNEAPDMPPELNQYYQAEKRQQNVVTWLLGFATLAITIAIAFLLFLSARWIVQKVRKNPASKPDTTQQEAVQNNGETAPTNVDEPTPTPTPTQSSANGGTGQTTGPGNTKPQTSSATNALPSTGPTETLAVFLIATTIGTFAYKRSIRQ